MASRDGYTIADDSDSEHGKTETKSPQQQHTSKTPQSRPEFRYRKHAIVLVALYAPLLIVSWVLTCALAKRPLNAPTYFYQKGHSAREISSIRDVVRFISVLNAIIGVAAIPLLSALLAQAAVVYTQETGSQHGLRMEQLFALADRAWTNPIILLKSRHWGKAGSNSIRRFLYFAAVLVTLGAIYQPLYQILVPFETITVPACNRMGCDYGATDQQTRGYDMEPAALAGLRQNAMMPKLVADIASVSGRDIQTYLWPDNVDGPLLNESLVSNLWLNEEPNWLRDLEHRIQKRNSKGTNFFVAGVETNTTTGVMRQHAMRLNSTVECQSVARSQFPEHCEGDAPFTASFGRGDELSVRVCVPGTIGKCPWSLSRNRQDIEEHLYIDIVEIWKDRSDNNTVDNNLTIHCSAQTTRGYFELGNYRNGNINGPLLHKWPTKEEMEREYNDLLTDGKLPTVEDGLADILGHSYGRPTDAWNASGPLMLSAVALFGETSYLAAANLYVNSTLEAYNNAPNKNTSDNALYGNRDTALPWQHICDTMPFSLFFDNPDTTQFPVCTAVRYSFGLGEWWSSNLDLRTTLNRWLHGWNDTKTATVALETSMFLANKALLTVNSWHDGNGFSPTSNPWSSWRRIYYSPGAKVQKPDVGKAAAVILSLIIFLQLLGLAYLLWFIYRTRTWTRALDAAAVVKLVETLENDGYSKMGGQSGSRSHFQTEALGNPDSRQG